MLVTQDHLARAEARLKALDPVAILRLVHATFGPRAALLSSMQRTGTALCHMADRAGLDLDVVFVDTGVLHQETLATRDRLAETHPNLRVVDLRPAQSFAEQTRDRGVLYLSKEGQEACCEARKSEPLRAQRGRWSVFLGALLREEGGRRAHVPFVVADAELGLLRVHPLAATTRADLERYEAEHPDVVVNPLHGMGFPSIGCHPCTTPVRPDEPERAGRWRHLADVTYCGINPTDRGAEPAPIAMDDAFASFFS